jgi:hypothetical protein
LIRLLFLLAAAALPACGDGGKLILRQKSGPFVVTALAGPEPLRAGPVEISVLVEDGQTGMILADATVDVEVESADGSIRERARASHDQSTNKLLQSAIINLNSQGMWRLRVDLGRLAQRGEVQASLAVEPALPTAVSLWPYFALPPLIICLFGLHQRRLLLRRK